MSRTFFLCLLAGFVGAAFNTLVAHAAPPTRMNVCTGGETGNYYKAGIKIAEQAKGVLDLNIVSTKGSMENLDKLSDGSCDAAIVQSDAYLVYKKTNPKSDLDLERAAALYPEYVHLVCNRASGITRVTQLSDKTPVAVGPIGSGSSVTWDSFVLADPATYKRIPTLPLAGTRAATKVAEGTDATCLLYVAGLKTTYMMEVNDGVGDKVVLVKADDGDMDKILDPKKKPVYTYEKIPGGTYSKIQDGMFSSVKTISTSAILVVNTKWIDANDRAYDSFLKAQIHAEAGIMKMVTPE